MNCLSLTKGNICAKKCSNPSIHGDVQGLDKLNPDQFWRLTFKSDHTFYAINVILQYDTRSH